MIWGEKKLAISYTYVFKSHNLSIYDSLGSVNYLIYLPLGFFSTVSTYHCMRLWNSLFVTHQCCCCSFLLLTLWGNEHFQAKPFFWVVVEFNRTVKCVENWIFWPCLFFIFDDEKNLCVRYVSHASSLFLTVS